ncbi:MAG: PilZ domain-containing protein [Candidatus Omnitrophica bacterium]|nr:PilZ domain-containing protein [Candidatus Omnitrophota bacterium]MCM8826997.1 PilZ domain-containing protein [Candidatus Omnitrophota bacterium]
MSEREKFNEDRRKYPRLNVVYVTYSIEGKNTEKVGVVLNIGAGGVCLIVNENLPPNTTLLLNIDLHDNKQIISAKGKVVWNAEVPVYFNEETNYEIGVEFVDIDEKERLRISQYVLGQTLEK